jgi:hypothetical protein
MYTSAQILVFLDLSKNWLATGTKKEFKGWVLVKVKTKFLHHCVRLRDSLCGVPYVHLRVPLVFLDLKNNRLLLVPK